MPALASPPLLLDRTHTWNVRVFLFLGAIDLSRSKQMLNAAVIASIRRLSSVLRDLLAVRSGNPPSDLATIRA
jgi:hypothetical protein